MAGAYDNKADEQCVAQGAAEPSGLKIETRSPRPGERQRSAKQNALYPNWSFQMTKRMPYVLLVPLAIRNRSASLAAYRDE